jgi:hypothetical protein
MNHEIIDIHSGSQHESYIVVSADGRITLHVETDEQKVDEEITIEELRQRSPHVAKRVEAALRRLRARRGKEAVP